jgi:hypothetical protein
VVEIASSVADVTPEITACPYVPPTPIVITVPVEIPAEVNEVPDPVIVLVA